MRVIITGGTGLIGRALAGSLIKDHHEVIILSRSPQKAADLPDEVKVEKWNARTAEGWVSLADDADAIVNLAGLNLGGEGFWPARWDAARKRLILESRLNAGKAVAEAVKAAARKPHLVIQASAIGYYGPHGSEELTEETPAGSDFGAQVCVEWENSTAAVKGMGVRHVVIRTGLVLSNKGGVLIRLAFPFKFFVGGPLGSGQQWMSWVHIADEVRAIRFLLESHTASGIFNLTAPAPVTNTEFSRTLGWAMRRPSWIPAPAFAFRLAFGEVATLVVDGQRVLPYRLLDAGFTFQFPELETALRDLLG